MGRFSTFFHPLLALLPFSNLLLLKKSAFKEKKGVECLLWQQVSIVATWLRGACMAGCLELCLAGAVCL